MHRNLGDLLRRRARVSPRQEAVVDLAGGQRLTYEALNARTNAVVHGLAALGIGKGDRVALLCYNGVEFVECLYGIAKLGAVAVPLNWRLTATELSFILQDSGTAALIFGGEFAEAAEAIQAGGETAVDHWIEIPAGTPAAWACAYNDAIDYARTAEPTITAGDDDYLMIVYTSGTTGLPKGAVHSHRTINAAIWTGILTIDLQAADRYLLVLPLFHVGATAPMVMHLARGGTLVLMRQFDPAEMWQAIEREKITKTLAVPAMLNFMLKVPRFQERDISRLKSILSGASPVPVALIEAYHAIGIEIHQVYGMTESFGPGCYLGSADAVAHAGSTGRSYMLTDVRVVDEEGRDAPPGTPGQVLLRGDHIMVGYWNNPEATAAAIVDGWLHTGDIAIADEDGYITIHDRLKDMIISGGENVYPAEVENVLLAHPDVADVAVIGQPSETWGECPFAVIVPAREGVAETDILSHCEGRLARFKQPRGIAFVDEIPRNPTGKPLKRVLRDRFPGPSPA